MTVVKSIILFFILANSLPLVKNSYLQCPQKYFQLPQMPQCHHVLSCSDISEINIYHHIGSGIVKDVYLASWKTHLVALSKLKNTQFLDDFQYGLNMLKLYSPSEYVTQLIGYCRERNIIVTEYHKYGNACNITNILKLFKDDGIKKRLKLCLNYAKILNYIHNGPGGTRVFCDSNDLKKTFKSTISDRQFKTYIE
uniref:Uncharacterized protein n=1 Tax=Clastoptera arizonana TaxID=38151 RepID=A0A1B6DL99_9HEMI